MFGPYVTVKLYTDFLLPVCFYYRYVAPDIFILVLFIIPIMFNRIIQVVFRANLFTVSGIYFIYILKLTCSVWQFDNFELWTKKWRKLLYVRIVNVTIDLQPVYAYRVRLHLFGGCLCILHKTNFCRVIPWFGGKLYSWLKTEAATLSESPGLP